MNVSFTVNRVKKESNGYKTFKLNLEEVGVKVNSIINRKDQLPTYLQPLYETSAIHIARDTNPSLFDKLKKLGEESNLTPQPVTPEKLWQVMRAIDPTCDSPDLYTDVERIKPTRPSEVGR